jgi:hypothetical protein
MLTRAIFIRPDSELIRESVCWWRKRAQIELCKNKNIDRFSTKTTQKGGFSKLCIKKKKRKKKKKMSYQQPTPFFNTYTVSTVRSYEYCTCQHWNFTGYKKIKQRHISFVLGYLRMILWKIAAAISIKHWILATFNAFKEHTMFRNKELLWSLK